MSEYFPEKIVVAVTDRWFGYDHLAVKEPFFEKDIAPPEHGAERIYVRKGSEARRALELLRSWEGQERIRVCEPGAVASWLERELKKEPQG